MSMTQAQATEMARVAGRFDEVHSSLQATLSTLMREVESVRGDWQGRGGTSFEQISAAWADDQKRLLRALAETANGIRTSGRTYSATDDMAADRLRLPPVALPL
jgi:WXG100 family type VII secretion target